MVSRRLPSLGVIANLAEYPAVAKGSARFRLQVMAKHSKQNVDNMVARLRTAYGEAQRAFRPYQSFIPVAGAATAVATGV
jgi:glycine C-acetyltransferase